MKFGRMGVGRNLDPRDHGLEVCIPDEWGHELVPDIFELKFLALGRHSNDAFVEIFSVACRKMGIESSFCVKSAKAPLTPMCDMLVIVAMSHEPGKIPDPGVMALCLVVGPVEEVDGFRIMFSGHVNGAVVEAIRIVEGVHIDVHLYYLLDVGDLVRRYGILDVV